MQVFRTGFDHLLNFALVCFFKITTPTMSPAHSRMSINVSPPTIMDNVSGCASIDVPLLSNGEVDVCSVAEDEKAGIVVDLEQVSTCGCVDTLHSLSTNVREQFIVMLAGLAILTKISVSFALLLALTFASSSLQPKSSPLASLHPMS